MSRPVRRSAPSAPTAQGEDALNQGYDRKRHGIISGVHTSHHREVQAVSGQAGGPGWPDLARLKELNYGVHRDAGRPERFALDQPSRLNSALTRVAKAYDGTPSGVAATLAAMGIKWQGPLVAAGVSIVMAGCGGSDKPTVATEAKPVDKRPRVQGTWRVVYRPRGEGETTRATWKMLPVCKVGPCSFKIKSTKKLRARFAFDTAIGDYRMHDRVRDRCESQSGTVLAKHAWTSYRQITLRVTDSIARNGLRYATRLTGRDFTTTKTTKAGAAAGCSDAPDVSQSVVAVRIKSTP